MNLLHSHTKPTSHLPSLSLSVLMSTMADSSQASAAHLPPSPVAPVFTQHFLKVGLLCCPSSVNNGFDGPAMLSQHTLTRITTPIKHVCLCTTQIPLGPTFWERTEQMISKKLTSTSWKVVTAGQSTQCPLSKCFWCACSRPTTWRNGSSPCGFCRQ